MVAKQRSLFPVATDRFYFITPTAILPVTSSSYNFLLNYNSLFHSSFVKVFTENRAFDPTYSYNNILIVSEAELLNPKSLQYLCLFNAHFYNMFIHDILTITPIIPFTIKFHTLLNTKITSTHAIAS